ncbi:hypothetical protein QBC37DRAFT_426677 [Rhypophila decipiens]|uniref:Uncharacterized protein n=1 Tax=Rhypophila decipiens TaxID=261697 RepID=A0AAN6Y5F4_9PEZI|nr:hypothetical protein QBC37DRAFT_426677 [Rhypophila decipiens]
MSDILSAVKDAINPKRREQATTPGMYDPHERGPYPDHPSQAVRDSSSQVQPPETSGVDSSSSDQLNNKSSGSGAVQDKTDGKQK